MTRLNKTESAIFISLFSLVALEGSTLTRTFIRIITTVCVRCCVGAVKSLPDLMSGLMTPNTFYVEYCCLVVLDGSTFTRIFFRQTLVEIKIVLEILNTDFAYDNKQLRQHVVGSKLNINI